MRINKLLKLFLISFLFIGCSTKQYYYVKDAELDKVSEGEKGALIEDREEAVKLLLNGHYIRAGNSLVLMLRRFDRGSIFSVDDETYEKLTIELRSYKVGVPIEIGSPNMDIYYSSGSSGFAKKGHGIYAASGTGAITIIKLEGKNRIVAKIEFTALAKPAGAFPFEEKRIKIQDTFVFKEKNIADLTPWLGVPSPYLGKEVYP